MKTLLEQAVHEKPFQDRHIGNSPEQLNDILNELGYQSANDLIKDTVPKNILDQRKLDIPEAASEEEALSELLGIMRKNKKLRSLIGLGFYDTHTPAVIQRNILESPAWYTQYTPYQAEIAQGRLEALINFQTMISDLCGLEISNASLLDESTACAEAMNMSLEISKNKTKKYFVSKDCYPQTIELLKTRSEALNIELVIDDVNNFDFTQSPFGVLFQYPSCSGTITNFKRSIEEAKNNGVIVSMATDLMALCLITPPGELGADIAVGSAQRFGVPLGFGGPHAGFIATHDVYKRKIPGRIVGVTQDSDGKQSYRLALQTREQHIRRDKATSNICTAQVLLAIVSSMYAVYHGAHGLTSIATRINSLARIFCQGVTRLKYKIVGPYFFDTVSIKIEPDLIDKTIENFIAKNYNVHKQNADTISIAFDEKSTIEEVQDLLTILNNSIPFSIESLSESSISKSIPEELSRTSLFLTHPVFNSYHSETEMMRYIRKLESRDLSLTRSMIPLGSCTMKLNSTSELMPISWPEVNSLHPFVPKDQAQGFLEMINQLEQWLCEITGFKAVSLQPNSGAQGELAGLLVISKYHESRGEGHRNICLIPASAHGTNPASAVLAGMKVVVIKCDSDGNIDLQNLKDQANKYADKLAALMITYPSTHGVFEESIVEICSVIHSYGAQVYMDGANLNAQIGLCKPGEFGPDVCHMNLHKTFCIPHGGGGPGVGPIGVKEHLSPFLPSHPFAHIPSQEHSIGPIAAAPWGSASILPISWMYIRMMGSNGLAQATKHAIINANYIAKKLSPHYPVVYKGKSGLVAHECIIDLSQIKKSAQITVEDVAKRLIDYGYHAPTVSWPVPNSMMIEPTESEDKNQIDRFCDAMIAIKEEINDIIQNNSYTNNILKNSPHTAETIALDDWDKPYSRHAAVYPLAWVKENKFWPYVSRVDNAYGDKNLICSCPSISEYADQP